jgi:hypothetical protein
MCIVLEGFLMHWEIAGWASSAVLKCPCMQITSHADHERCIASLPETSERSAVPFTLAHAGLS